MDEVYRATDTQLGREVAITVAATEGNVLQSPTATERVMQA